MLFAGADAAAAHMRETDAVIAERFLAGLHELFPQTRGKIAGATVRRWPLGNVYARPGRARLQPALEGPLGPHQNLHLAGATSPSSGPWRPPPGPGSRPPNASTPNSER
jgi:protoporphyrinogen/coproporphyrinogen III oxidase